MQGDKQRSFAVEALGNDNKVVGIENLAGAHDRVEGTEPGVIEHDIGGVDAAFD